MRILIQIAARQGDRIPCLARLFACGPHAAGGRNHLARAGRLAEAVTPDPITGLRQEIRELVVVMVAIRNKVVHVALAGIAGIIVGVLIR